MFIGKLKNISRIKSLHPAFKTLFNFIENHDFNKLPLGKVEIDGDNVFVMNLDIQKGAELEQQPLEMHRKYIDVHILLGGSEKIGWRPIEDILTYSQKYDESCDCALSNDAPQFYVDMHPGDVCIVYPEDPHAPAISEGTIRKLIGKVKI